MTTLPRQALLGVVGRPHVERRQRVDGAPVGDREVRGDLGPGPDPHSIRLEDVALAMQRVQRRLAIAPHALLQRPGQLRLVGLANEIGALMVERGVEEEPLVVELEVLLGLANATLAQGEELLAFGESPHSHSPFFKGDWHIQVVGGERRIYCWSRASITGDATAATGAEIVRDRAEIPKYCCKSRGLLGPDFVRPRRAPGVTLKACRA